MSGAETSRFSVTLLTKEVNEIHEYTQRTGVPRNELIRRATLAYIRMENGKGTDIKKLFQKVGSIDAAEDVMI